MSSVIFNKCYNILLFYLLIFLKKQLRVKFVFKYKDINLLNLYNFFLLLIKILINYRAIISGFKD